MTLTGDNQCEPRAGGSGPSVPKAPGVMENTNDRLNSIAQRLSGAIGRLTVVNDILFGANPPSEDPGKDSMEPGSTVAKINMQFDRITRQLTSMEEEVARLESGI